MARGSAWFPRVDARLSANRIDIDPQALGGASLPIQTPLDLYLATVSVSYNLDIFGATRHEMQALQSGIVFGFAGQVEGIARRMAVELSPEDPGAVTVIATGGLAPLVIGEVPIIDAHEQLSKLAVLAPTYNFDPGLLVMEIGTLLASAAPPRERAHG